MWMVRWSRDECYICSMGVRRGLNERGIGEAVKGRSSLKWNIYYNYGYFYVITLQTKREHGATGIIYTV